MTVKTIEKEEDFVPEGMLPEEIAALAEAAAEDAADAADDTTLTDDEALDVAEAIEAKDGEDDDAAAAKPAADTAETGKDAAAAADTAAAKDDAGKPAADAVVQNEDETEVAPRQAMPKFEAPADADKQLADIATKRDALAEQFDNGEINAKTLFAEQATLNKQERAIETAVERAAFSADMAKQTWFQNTVPDFFAANPHYEANDALRTMLNAEVVRRQSDAIEKGGDQLDPHILIEADKAIKEALAGLGVAPSKDAAAAAGAGKEAAAADPAKGAKAPMAVAAKPAIPPTLRGLPSEDITGTDSKWAGLDRLADADPLAFEDAMGKLPEADRDRYLARQ